MKASRSQRKLAWLFTALVLVGAQLACKVVERAYQVQPEISPVLVVTPTPQIIIVTATPQVGPTSAPAQVLEGFSDEQIRTGIQETLDLYARAYTENDPSLFEKAIDQDNKPFRRIVRSRFDDYQQSSQGGSIEFHNTLLSTTRREFGYVIAHFEDQDGWQADWPFRYAGDHWVLTEPSVDEIGKPVTTEAEHFTFITYPWDDDVNASIEEMLEKARQVVGDKLGKVPDEKATVRIVPIYGIDPFSSMFAIAWYSMGGDENGGDLIHIYAPNSYAYSYYDPAAGWDGQLQQTITHEYTHMVHARSFKNAGRFADWMSEGLAEYVAADPDNIKSACYAFKDGVNIPILDQSSAVRKQDLMHLRSLEKDTGLAYAYSHALTAFVIEKHGGLDGFWKLAAKLDDSSDFKKALKMSFNLTYNDFNKEWEAWLANQCR